MKNAALLRSQLDEVVSPLRKLRNIPPPPSGWIKAMREALGIPLRHLAKRLRSTTQNVQKLEFSERNASISLKNMRKIADSLDMDFVYFLLPRDSSLEKMLFVRAESVAKSILNRAARSMSLEDQGTSKKRIEQAILEMTHELVRTMPRHLWD